MNCMKCGREIPEDQVFCLDCLKAMEKYPIPHNTPVQLPRRRDAAAARRAQKKRAIPPEDQIRQLKSRIRKLTLALVLTAILAIILAFPAIDHLLEDDYEVGQNYKSFVTNSTSADSETDSIN